MTLGPVGVCFGNRVEEEEDVNSEELSVTEETGMWDNAFAGTWGSWTGPQILICSPWPRGEGSGL